MTVLMPDLTAAAALWLVALVVMVLIFNETASPYYQRRAATRAAAPANGTGRSPADCHPHRAQILRPCRGGWGGAEGDLSQLSHRLSGQHRTQADSLDIRRILTCGFGFWRTGWTRWH